MKRVSFVALVVALLGLLSARWARAQEGAPSVRPATLAFDDRQLLRMSVSYRDVVDGPTSAKLQGGLPTTIVMRAYVFREGGSAALAATYKICRVTFDLWDEVYRIEISQTGLVRFVDRFAYLGRCAEAMRRGRTPGRSDTLALERRVVLRRRSRRGEPRFARHDRAHQALGKPPDWRVDRRPR